MKTKSLYRIVLSLLLVRKKKEHIGWYELNYIAIGSNYHGWGIGSNLINHGLDHLQKRGVKKCFVKTLSKTSKTIRFYEKLGFKIYDQFIGRQFLSKIV